MPRVSDYRTHPGLRWLNDRPDGARWLAGLPAVVRGCAERWELALDEPFSTGNASLALPARLRDGTDAVLKVQWPHEECRHEAAALAHWDGAGAVRLLAADAAVHALLIERCRPGTALTGTDPDTALDVLAGLLPRLLRPAGAPIRSLADEAAGWAANLPTAWRRAGEPFPRRLLDLAVGLCTDLGGSQGPLVLVHQDLHGDNVLRATREPWLAIDPKPLLAEREFAVAPVVRSGELGHSPRAVRRRLDRLVDELDLDRDRALGWTIAQSVAWAFDGDRVLAGHVEVAEWLLER
jgi:streptomycin 6-kinase